MVVKVQLSQHSSDGVRRVLVYNKTRNIHYEGEATPELIEHMKGKQLAYFSARLVGTEVDLGPMLKLKLKDQF